MLRAFFISLSIAIAASLVMADDSIVNEQILRRDWLKQAELRFAPGTGGQGVSCEDDAIGAIDGVINGKWGFHTDNQ
jgi:hypothetical protein